MRTDLRRVLDHLRGEAGGLSDGQLLARFVTARDESSFAALVGRHGRMVYGVCRRVLRNSQDAEDAFQTTFLVLARKAASVVKRESVGAFLYGVAYRTALAAAASLSRRRATELQVEELPHPASEPDDTFDLRPLLDREVSLLPERLRAAVVLCDLEGRTRREAARQLRIAEGTLSSRLQAAHKILAKRLARTGFALTACAISAALAESRASAELPSALIRHAAKVAAVLGAGSTPAVILWMKGAFQMMFCTKWWPVLAAVAVAGAVGVVGVSVRPGDPSGSAQAAPPKQESELDALRKEVEMLKLNLQIVLEKNRALEGELKALRGQGPKGGGDVKPGQPGATPLEVPMRPGGLPGEEGSGLGLPGADNPGNPLNNYSKRRLGTPSIPVAGVSQDVIDDMKAALKVLRDGRGGDKAGGRSSVDNEKLIQNLEAVLKALQEARDAAAPKKE